MQVGRRWHGAVLPRVGWARGGGSLHRHGRSGAAAWRRHVNAARSRGYVYKEVRAALATWLSAGTSR
jgi:hypothetical protein